MDNFLEHLLDSSDFPARWHCGNWSDGHGWLHVLSDLAIFAAYMAIPIVLGRLIAKRKDLPFPRVFVLFVAFILFCGVGHLIDAVIFWKPVYRLSGLLKLSTAVASWATVLALVPTARKVLTLRSPEQLEREVAARTSELAREKATLEAILSSISAGIAVADANGNFTLFNRAAATELGLGPAQVPWSQWGDAHGFFHLDGTTRYADDQLPHARVLQHETAAVDEDLRVRNPNFEGDRILAMSARPVRGASGFEGVVLACTDITNRVRTEEELLRSNQDLEEFAYAASHDLKEPLRQIAGFSELLAEEASDKLDDDERRHLRFVCDGAQRMTALLNGLLRYSRAGYQDAELVELDTNAVVADVLIDLERAIEDSGGQVHVSTLPRVVMDRVHFTQIIQNLVANALKFHGVQPPIVSISAVDEGAHYRFAVQDNGVGIATEHKERVFRMFQRLHAQSHVPGTGIGLALCHRIIGRYGGKIWIDSVLDQGATFHFTIPKALRAPTLTPQGQA